jgi:FAD:protein FMN transferase
MGTRFELLLHGADPVHARAVGEAAIEEIEGWHHRLSRFTPDSLVSCINRTAGCQAVRLDGGTFALLEDALRVWRASAGAFDITLAGRSSDIVLDPVTRTVRFRGVDIRIDLGAIAKGHALDAAAALLREHGIDCALLHGGTSSVVALGAPPGNGAGWRVALGRDAAAPVVVLRDAALSVSTPAGGGAREQGDPPHIVDPRTGMAPASIALAAVIGPGARLADAWTTALAVLGARPAGLQDMWTSCLRQDNRPDRWAGPLSPEPASS